MNSVVAASNAPSLDRLIHPLRGWPAALLWIALSGSAHAAEHDARTGWLPAEPVVKPLMAATSEAVNELSFSRFRRDGTEVTLGNGKLGLEFGFYGWQHEQSITQIGLMASTQSQFNMSTSSDVLVNTDYFLAIPLLWRGGPWEIRTRLLHQSSHLGDEFLLSGNAPERKNLSYEALDLLAAYHPAPGWRLYVTGGYIIASDLDEIGNVGGGGGVEYLSPNPVWGRAHWVTAFNTNATEAFESDMQVRLISGLRIASHTVAGNALTIAAQGFTGPIPFGQFFSDSATYYGFALFFERF